MTERISCKHCKIPDKLGPMKAYDQLNEAELNEFNTYHAACKRKNYPQMAKEFKIKLADRKLVVPFMTILPLPGSKSSKRKIFLCQFKDCHFQATGLGSAVMIVACRHLIEEHFAQIMN